MEDWLAPGENPSVQKGWSPDGFPSSPAGRCSCSSLIVQSWDTSTGHSSKLLEGADEAWDPQCFAFSKPVWETGSSLFICSIRNCFSLFSLLEDCQKGV